MFIWTYCATVVNIYLDLLCFSGQYLSGHIVFQWSIFIWTYCVTVVNIYLDLLCLKDVRPNVQTLSYDPASVNAMKPTCVIIILAYFT